MPVFQVRQGATGAILWTGSATSEIQALDAMAHAAGYYDHSDIPDEVRQGGLAVEALSFGGSAAGAASRAAGAGRSRTVVALPHDTTKWSRPGARAVSDRIASGG